MAEWKKKRCIFKINDDVRMKFNSYLTPYSQINFRYIKYTNEKGKTITCFEINKGEYHCDISIEKGYLRHKKGNNT